MTVLDNTRLDLIAAIRSQLPTVSVSAAPLAEDTPLREAIWFAEGSSDFEWKRLGSGNLARAKDEEVSIELRVQVYREKPDQTEAALEVLARAEELYQGIETAALTVAQQYGFIRRWRLVPRPAEKGWIADGYVTFEGRHHP